MNFLLTAYRGMDSNQLIVTEKQAAQTVEAFLRVATSADETSYHLRAVGIVNEAKDGKVKVIEFKSRRLVVQRNGG